MKDTAQMGFWKGGFGDEYTERNTGDWDRFYKEEWGVTRTELNKEFVGDLPLGTRILEVGCNRGHQLELLKQAGFTNLTGIEINSKALEIARQDASLNLVEGSALNIPFEDGVFDLVFTSGVLIHISPDDLPAVIDEMYRVSKEYIWCFEYYAEQCEPIEYRG
jgi:pseudaminic acid biosynthesis-associated methylase